MMADLEMHRGKLLRVFLKYIARCSRRRGAADVATTFSLKSTSLRQRLPILGHALIRSLSGLRLLFADDTLQIAGIS